MHDMVAAAVLGAFGAGMVAGFALASAVLL